MLNALQEIKEATEAIKNFTESTKEFFVITGKVLYYLSHPAKLASLIWGGMVQYSFVVCLIICMISLLAYLIGVKKARRIPFASFMIYLVIQMINTVI